MLSPFRLGIFLITIGFFEVPFSFAITLHVTDDHTARIDQPVPSHNRHSSWKERLKKYAAHRVDEKYISVHKHSTGYEEQGFVKFDLSPLPPDGSIQQATLRLWINQVKKPGTLHLHEILADWNEDTIRKPPLPPVGPVFESLGINKNDTAQFVTIEITTLLRDWLERPSTNFGLALISDSNTPLSIAFDSKENPFTSHPVEIEVTLLPGVGQDGQPGIQGPQGDQGAPGPQGPPGLPGQGGLNGPPGPIGATGLTGPTGKAGPPGHNGTTWLTGTELPLESQGQIGDFYLKNDTGEYFTKTDSITWVYINTLRGPAGPSGEQGPQGDQGAQGDIGPPGPTGSTGPQGPPGTTPLLIMVGQNCPAGEFLTGFDLIGNILCGAPPLSSDPPAPSAINDVDPGDVLITEIMVDPSAVTDSKGEWFELFNTRAETIDIRGWKIEDESGNTHSIPDTDPILIPAGQFLVLGNNDDASTNGGIAIAHEYTALTLNNNGGDTLIVFDVNGEEIDRVDYGISSFSVPAGASLNLDSNRFDFTNNDDGTNWCSSTTSIGTGLDLGTPGTTNEAC